MLLCQSLVNVVSWFNIKEFLTVLMLCAPITKMADFEYFRVLSVFSWSIIGINYKVNQVIHPTLFQRRLSAVSLKSPQNLTISTSDLYWVVVQNPKNWLNSERQEIYLAQNPLIKLINYQSLYFIACGQPQHVLMGFNSKDARCYRTKDVIGSRAAGPVTDPI